MKLHSQSGADAWENGVNAMKSAAEPVSVKVFRLCGMIAVILLLIYKCAALGKEIVVSYRNDYWIAQKDYENYETQSYEINGVTFYYPVNGDQVGYEAFPSAPVKADVQLLGEGIEDGFAPVLSN